MKEVSIRGYNLDRFITNLLMCGIKPKKMKRVQYDELIIEISDKDYKKLLVNKFVSCYNINVLKSKAKLTPLVSVFKRIGLIVGAVVGLAIMFALSNKLSIITINVDGENSQELKQQAEEILKQNNIAVGQKFDFSYRELENLLISSLDTSARVMVKKNGNELVINIAQLVEKPEEEHSNIVASFDGKITTIEHSSGILKVNIGEGVVKGQVLIESGYIGDFFSEASGDIYAKVVISGSAVGSTNQESVKRTGRSTVVTGFKLFRKTFAVENTESYENLYSNYEIEEEEIYLSRNMVLPLRLVKYRIYELETIKSTIPEAEVIESLKNKAYLLAKQKLPVGAQEGQTTFDVFNDNGYINVICNIETEISIGERK